MSSKRRLYYFGFYVNPDHIAERIPILSPASTSKMSYIADCLGDDFDVRIVSPGFCSSLGSFCSKEVAETNRRVTYLASAGDGKPFLSFKKALFARARIAEFIDEHIDGDADVLVYSQPWANGAVINALKKKGKSFVLEVEELHATNEKTSLPRRVVFRFVEKHAISKAMALIVINEAVKGLLDKESIVCHGEYVPGFKESSYKGGDEKDTEIGILYSGGIDEERGIFLLMKSLGLLPTQYRDSITLHIAGYFHGHGSKDTRDAFEMSVKQLEASGLRVMFYGTLRKEELESLVERCQICVSPQLIENNFSVYSFPSKILFYLTRGKLVVSSAIPAVLSSPFANFLVMYSQDKPERLVEAIAKAIDSMGSYYVASLKELHTTLKKEHQRFKEEVLQLFKLSR